MYNFESRVLYRMLLFNSHPRQLVQEPADVARRNAPRPAVDQGAPDQRTTGRPPMVAVLAVDQDVPARATRRELHQLIEDMLPIPGLQLQAVSRHADAGLCRLSAGQTSSD